MYINGSVSLILCDGAHISFDEGINIAEGSALTVYGGTEGTGELIASLSDKEYYAAIGGGKKENGGSLIIKGGKITAKSSSEAPAIGAGGGDYYHLKGNIDIYGGIVTAEAGKYGSGIGAGYYGNLDGSVNIYGGEVNATGGKYGSGIGGGDNGVGADVIVEGSSVILATGGMNTTSAIGHGNNETECGTLQMPDSSWVKAGASLDDDDRVPAGDRVRACQNNKFAMILPACDHFDRDYRSVDLQYHEQYCEFCGESLSEKEEHSWNSNHVCPTCGAYNGWTVVTMKWRDTGNGEMNNAYEVTKNSKYTLPECPDIPKNKEFICWRVSGGDYDNDFFEPGDLVTPTDTSLTLEAVYYTIEKTYYIDERGSESEVNARRINVQSSCNYYLTSGWYVINNGIDNLSIPDNIYFIIDGNVHLIIPDEQHLVFDTPSASGAFKGDSLSVYGQFMQNGKISMFYTSRNINSLKSFSQYGAVINASDIEINCKESFTIKRGSFQAGKVTTKKANIIGGTSQISRIDSDDMNLGWTDPSDSIRIDVPYVKNDATVVEDQTLKDENNHIYTDKLFYDTISNKTLTPYIEHQYDEYVDPEWTWADDYSSAYAVFACIDPGCEHTVKVNADIHEEYKGKESIYTAVCDFQGKCYTDEKTAKNKWSVVVKESDCGTVTPGVDKAEFGKEISLDIQPDEGYSLFSLTVVDDFKNPVAVSDNKFSMPASEVTIKAEFVRHFDSTDPYIDENGAYIPGIIEYIIDSKGDYFPLNKDGSAGEKIDTSQLPEALENSWFTFKTRSWISKYTGPTENLTVLEIPKTYKGKTVTTLGNNTEIIDNGGSKPFELKLTENITTISNSAFNNSKLTKVTGDTSGLNSIGMDAFSNVNSENDNRLDITLSYPGVVDTVFHAFNGTNVTFHLDHKTTVSDTEGAKSVTYDFTDDHIYGEPAWDWSDDHSTASASFVCTDERCRHKKTIEAAVNKTMDGDTEIYTATIETDGKTYTNSKNVYADNIGARLMGYTLSLDGDIGVNFYMELSDEIAASDTAYMKFNIPSGEETDEEKINVSDARTVVSGE